MSRLIRSLPVLGALVALGLAFYYPLTVGETADFLTAGHFGGWFVAGVILIAAVATLIKDDAGPAELWLAFAAIAAGVYLVALLTEAEGHAGPGYWALAASAILVTLQLALRLLTIRSPSRWLRAARAVAVPLSIAVLILLIGEIGIRGSGLAASVPPPSVIAHELVTWATGAPAEEEPADVAGGEAPAPTP
ncbi:MAG: hypothetical protein IT535_10610 [Bauldia sp.]|nr:hypothetical protein [Bauldia sp.]